MKPLADCFLYAFVDTAFLRGRAPDLVARQLCDGGADLIQLRAKGLPVDEVTRLAEALVPITERADVGLVINDHPAVARAVGAPLVHLGQEDFFDRGYTHVTELAGEVQERKPQVGVPTPGLRPTPFDVGGDLPSLGATSGPGREAVSPAALANRRPPPRIGLSTHAPEQAERALAAGAAYIAIGPVYATGTKPTARPVTLDYVRWAAAHVPVPWFAIGGIHFGNLDAVLAAGAQRLCMVSALLDAPDLVRACQTLKHRLLSAARRPE